MLISQIANISKDSIYKNASQIQEGRVLGFGSGIDKYRIQFKNGAELTDVQGPVGLNKGDSISIAAYPGNQKFIIIGKSYISARSAKTVGV